MSRVLREPHDVRAALAASPQRPPCGAVLMAEPTHFRVESVINPWMADASGNLNQVDPARALEQWQSLQGSYESMGIRVEVIGAQHGLPDFCFSANQSLTFRDARGRRACIISHMRSETRVPETPWFEHWYREHGFIVHRMSADIRPFEGTGDAIWHHGRRLLWGGVGPRTADQAWELVARITLAPVIPLHLVDARFYHLDTCLCVLNEHAALYVPEAFDEASLARLHFGFRNLIPVTPEEAANFACNAHCPDDHNVLIQQGSPRTVAALLENGFAVTELDTSEFMKSGGSVFCLKQELP